MTPQEIEESARRRLNAVSDKLWSQAEVFDYIYFACMRLAVDANVIENRYTSTTVASQREYVRPTRAIAIKRIEYNKDKLTKVDLRQWDILNTSPTSTTTGTPLYYWLFDSVVALHPTPSAAKELRIYSYDEPSRVTASGSLEVPSFYHDAVVAGTVAFMVSKEVGHPMVAFYLGQWEAAVKRVKIAEKLRDINDSFARVKREEDLYKTTIGVV